MKENVRISPGDVAAGEIEVLSEREAWSSDAARLLEARLRFPALEQGRHVERTQFRLAPSVEGVDGVVAVPVRDDDRILLVRQFRHPTRMWVRELPRGGREPHESPREAVARELREELGCESAVIHSLGRIATDSGQQSSLPHLFAVRVTHCRDADLEQTEVIDGVFAYTFTELVRACQRGDIVDAFTLAAVLRVQPHFRGDRFVFREELAAVERDPEAAR